MDIIFIRDLRVETLIGVYPLERQNRQILFLDLELGADIRPAAATDCLDDFFTIWAAVVADGDDRGFVEHNALAANVN